MTVERYTHTKRTLVIANLAVGLALLLTGILLKKYDINVVQNPKAVIGLSFIPLGIALSAFINIIFVKRYPKAMNAVIISENDERLTAIRNEADSKTFRILRWALLFVFFGYTFSVPTDVFEAPGWWTVFAFLFLSYVLPAIFFRIGYGKNNDDSE